MQDDREERESQEVFQEIGCAVLFPKAEFKTSPSPDAQ
jgi:hypothetical protein